MIFKIMTTAMLFFNVVTAEPVQTLAGELGIGPGGLCAPGSVGDEAFASLFTPSGRFRPTVKTTRRRLSVSSMETKESATFAVPVRWNGLPILAAEKRHVANAESEGMEERVLVIGANPDVLRTLFREHGQVFPLAPGYLSVDVEPEGGAASIAPHATGAVLRCAWDA